MEVRLRPDLEAQLDRVVKETGRAAGEVTQDAMAGYFAELAQVRGTLDRRSCLLGACAKKSSMGYESSSHSRIEAIAVPI